jgi:hypothetical protein
MAFPSSLPTQPTVCAIREAAQHLGLRGHQTEVPIVASQNLQVPGTLTNLSPACKTGQGVCRGTGLKARPKVR